MKNKDIADKLGTTEHVVKNDLRFIYNKLGLWNRVELALWYIKHYEVAKIVCIMLLVVGCSFAQIKIQPKVKVKQQGNLAIQVNSPACAHPCVSLSWTASNSQGVTSYNLYRVLTSNTEVLGSPTYTGIACCAYNDTINLQGGTTYYYKATAVCSSCSPQESQSFSNETSGTIPNGAPNPPTNLTVTTIAQKTGGYKDVLAWDASSTQGVVYRVKRSETSGGPYSQIAGGIPKLTYQDKAVLSKQTYYYVATAYLKATGLESVNSNQVQATIP